jgi:putative flippase GtrA
MGATAVNYFLSERFGFLSGNRSRTGLVIGVYFVSSAGLAVDILVLWALYSVLSINVMVAKIIGTAAAFVVNFGGRQFFVFTRHPRWSSLSALGRRVVRTASSKRDNLSRSHDRKLQ